MFQVGDFVVNAANGICRIEEVVELDLSGDRNLKPYFLLIPLGESAARVFIPIDRAGERIRRALGAEEAEKLLEQMAQVKELTIESEKVRELTYKNAIKSCDPGQMIALLKTLQKRRAERIAQGKKSTAIDDRYYKLAEKHLKAEFAFALGKTTAEIEQQLQAGMTEVC